MEYQTVYHNFEPLYQPNSKILLLGSIPSPKSREQGFFYGHPQNRFWRVLAAVCQQAVPQTIAEKRALCIAHRIALWDVLASCEIKGASDAAIRNPVANPIESLIAKTQIEAVFTTGTTAYTLYQKLCAPRTHLSAQKLPSTSPANAAWTIERLITQYTAMLSPYI